MDLLQLVARLSLDSSEYESGIKNAKSSITGLGKTVKTGAKILGAATVAGISAASAAVGVLIKQSVTGYAEQQQMVGGVQKLYGNMGKSLEEYAKSIGLSTDQAKSEWSALEKAQNLVLKNSQKAYKTAGMSANEYMSMATSFSASLINSLNGDTVKAAKQTDVAMRAISDNFNTFGGDIGMIQGAFQGFAKQNYTMLDNLKLGYGGTKTEMQRLIEDANTWAKENGKAADLSIDSFSDVVTAIDYIQQKQNIAGTTARESSTTIEGSLLSLKAAWDNLVTGFADPKADISKLMENVVMSATTASKNLIPAITQALNGIGQAIDQILPEAIGKIPTLFNNILVPMVKTGTNLLQKIGEGIVSAAPGLLASINSIFPQILDIISTTANNAMSAFNSIDFGAVGDVIMNGIRTALDGAMDVFNSIDFGKAGDVLMDGLGAALESAMSIGNMFVSAGSEILGKMADGLTEGVPQFLESFMPMLLGLSEYIRANAGTMIDAGLNLLVQLAQGIANGLPVLIAYLPQIISNIANVINDNAPKVLLAGVKIIVTLAQGIIKALPAIKNNALNIAKMVFDVFMAINWLNLGSNIITFIKNGITTLQTAIPETLKNIGQKAMEWLSTIQWSTLGADIIDLIVIGIQSLGSALPGVLKTIATTAWNTFKSIPWASVGKAVISTLATGISSSGGKIKGVIKGIVDKVKSAIKTGFDSAKKSAINSFKSMVDGVKKQLEKIKSTVKSVVDKVKGFFPLKIGKIFSGMKLPHFSISGSPPFGIGGKGTKPSISVKWYKKAMENPYLFSNATLFGAGETGARDEMLYSKHALMEDIASAVSGQQESTFGRAVQITNYITVEGAEDPEDFAERFIRKLKLDMRTA